RRVESHEKRPSLLVFAANWRYSSYEARARSLCHIGTGVAAHRAGVMVGFERLSGLDESFLGFETRNAPMHVAVTGIFERGPLGRARGGIDLDRIREHIAARLPRMPRFRQPPPPAPPAPRRACAAAAPSGTPRHLPPRAPPRPGPAGQLAPRRAGILERPLDRRRPLWETWVVEGLAGGGFALVAKV